MTGVPVLVSVLASEAALWVFVYAACIAAAAHQKRHASTTEQRDRAARGLDLLLRREGCR